MRLLFFIFAQGSSSQHSHNFYTMRKHPTSIPAQHHQFSKATDVDHKLPPGSSNNRNSETNCRRNNFAESAEEFVAQYREKQKAELKT